MRSQQLTSVFRREVFPVLTPLAIDPGHPFPHLQNKSLNLAVLLRRPHNPDRLFAVHRPQAAVRQITHGGIALVFQDPAQERAEPVGARGPPRTQAL